MNAELANNLGNLLSRVIKLVHKGFKGYIPQGFQNQKATQRHILNTISLAENVKSAIKDLAPHKAIDLIVDFLSKTNRYLEELKPWIVLKNNPENKDIIAEALYTCLESLRISGILLYPVMPVKMGELLHILGWNQVPYLEDAQRWGLLQEGSFISEVPPLFQRIDNKKD